ncbi:MAG: hypothetical protein Ct9H300mP12_03350 [Acidimicrobiales bacterium]|nr:MAG: hypothetical protein Ct9H300mP12_03350 [Acidimicrobiales bacterium]
MDRTWCFPPGFHRLRSADGGLKSAIPVPAVPDRRSRLVGFHSGEGDLGVWEPGVAPPAGNHAQDEGIGPVAAPTQRAAAMATLLAVGASWVLVVAGAWRSKKSVVVSPARNASWRRVATSRSRLVVTPPRWRCSRARARRPTASRRVDRGRPPWPASGRSKRRPRCPPRRRSPNEPWAREPVPKPQGSDGR